VTIQLGINLQRNFAMKGSGTGLQTCRPALSRRNCTQS